MITINDILNRIEAINIKEEGRIFIESIKEDIKELNQERMLQGRRADGSIMPPYSNASVIKFGKEPGPIKLLDTGSFQNNIFIKVDADSFTSDSRDSKKAMLKETYGEEILGLGEPERLEIVEFKNDDFINQIRNKIKL
jgi:hypothetical protein